MNIKELIFMLKELRFYKGQVFLFCLCLLFSLGIFISVDSLRENVEDYVNQDSKTLVGGDLLIDSNKPYLDKLQYKIDNIKVNNSFDGVVISEILEFSSVVYSPKSDNSILSQIKVVDLNHPLYGEIELGSGEKYSLNSNEVIVEQELLDRLEINIGDSLSIGKINFTIIDTLVSEPDTPLSLFSLGPKILFPEVDINSTGLIGLKSRVEYKTRIKTLNDVQMESLYLEIEPLLGEREKLDRYTEANSTLERFIINFLFFIKLISIFIIFITGVGLTSTLTSYLSSVKQTIGIRKVLGTKNSTIISYYIKLVLLLGIISFMLALLFSMIFMLVFPFILSSILPDDLVIGISFFSVIKGFILALGISVLFTLYPIISLKSISPIEIFKKQEQGDKSFFSGSIFYFFIFLFFAILIFLELESISIGIYILLGITFLVVFTFLFTYGLLKFVKFMESKINIISLKLAIKGLFRLGNKTLLIITSLSISLTLIFSLTFIEGNLQDQFITAFPENAPNLFIIDIPSNNKDDFNNFLIDKNYSTIIYPIIRAPILSVNGVGIKEISDSLGQGDSVTREFSVTYLDKITSGEKIIEGDNLFVDNWGKELAQVSVLDDIADRLSLKIGDKIIFLVQGVEIEAEVVSFRTRVEEGIGAFFYFTFEKEVLENAPQTLFATLRIPSDEVSQLQTQIAKSYPSVTVINAESTAKTIGDIISQLSSITSFFTIFSLIGGILILISSILATHEERLKETIYYKLVGGNSKFITRIFLFEYFILGLFSTIFALMFSFLISFGVSNFLLDIDFSFLILEGLVYLGITMVSIILIGYFSVILILKKKPIEYIRENNIE
jgi:putative ABC transport system permease protein